MLTRRELLYAAAAATLVPAYKPAPASAQIQRFGFIATRAIAKAGFIYGLPIVKSYAAMYEQAVDRRSGHFKAPFNRIKHDHRVFTHRNAGLALPNNDTLHSVVWMDLRAEPVVLSVPAVNPERYYSVMLRDGNFYSYGYLGSRATGNEAGDYMVVGPDWSGETPSDIKKVFRSTTQFSLALYRTQFLNAEDVGNARRVQAGYKVEPLSKNRQQPAPPPPESIKFRKTSEKLLRKNFFQNLAFALQFSPSQFVESDARANLAKIGVGPGKTFDFSDLSLKEKLEITAGIRAGDGEIDRAAADRSVTMNGWRIASHFGDSAFYGDDWLLRAAAAKSGTYGNDPQEAVVAFAEVDDNGETLDGSKHDYTLTFAPDRLPPAKAFWSLTMYDGKTRSLIKNPINRHLFNSSMLPATNTPTNGGLTIYIQHKPPVAQRKANWLPAPNGPMLLALRLYWPGIEQPSILPVGKGTWRPPGVMRA